MKIKNCGKLELLLSAFILLFFANNVSARVKDSVQVEKEVPKIYKNTIRVNLTNVAIFGESYVVGYERSLKPNQSLSINMGTFTIPRLTSIDLDSIQGVSQENKVGGYSISGDYRFYLSKVNKYDGPRGVYIGPYFSFNQSKNKITLNSTTDAYTGKFYSDLKFGVNTVGFQLGYQFVFWKRMSLDMILMGPGVSVYSYKNNLSTTLSDEQEAELFQKINDALAEKLPGYSLVVNPGMLERSGSFKTTSLGYRYVVMVGFRF